MGGRKTSPIIIVTLFASVIFLLPYAGRASPDHVVINEVQTTGGEGHTTSDFVELFNPTATPFNLKGHRLVKRTAAGTNDTTIKSWTDDALIPAYGFYLWANSDYTSISTPPDAATSGSLADNNGIALRQGAQDTGAIVDSIAWGNSTNNFMEGASLATNPGPNQSLERKKPLDGSRQDTNNNADDFTIQANPTPQNSTATPETPAPANNNSTGTYPMSPTNNPQAGEVVINEIVSDPGSGGEEWLELYNRSDRVIDLSKFTIEDGSHTITGLSGKLDTEAGSRFIILKSPKGNLNNDGDLVILKFADTIIDQVAYGNWDDGNTSNNAPVARAPLSIGRLPDGRDNNNDQMDFAITNPTIGTPNQASSSALTNSDNKSVGLTFSEIYPNPPLSDQVNEFIELFNNSEQSINLNGWTIKDEITIYTINDQTWTSTTIEPKKFFMLTRPKTGIALDNEGTEHLILSSPDNKTVFKINYTGPAAEGASYAQNEQDEWQWTAEPTPGQPNKIVLIDEPPHLGFSIPKKGAVGELIILDASDTIDPEGKLAAIFWDLGDGTLSTTITPSHIYNKAGRYTVKLKALDQAGNETSDSQTITVENDSDVSGRVAGIVSGPIELTEIMPNPKGSDANEWLELYNPNDTAVTTADWQIQINERHYQLPNSEIAPETYLVINKKDGNFSLLNKKTNLALIAPTGEKMSQLEYNGVKEGYSYALENKIWQWTSESTPGSENIIANITTKGDYQTVSLAEARLQESGSKIITEGVVSSTPGVLAKNLMFLGSEGLQISLSDNNWPILKMGDQIRISGTISRSTTGTKLLVRKSDQLTVISSGQAPEPAKLALADITEDNEGQLIATSGQITKSAARSFTISADNTSLAVSLKNAELNWPKLKTGTDVTVTGFVTLTKDGLKFFARSPEDIVIKNLPIPPPQIIDLSQNPKESNWASYILAMATVLAVAVMYLWQKFNWPNLLKLIGKLYKNKAANQ